MKKCLAVLLSVLLLIGVMTVGVSAGEGKFTETSRRQSVDASQVEILFTMPDGGVLNEVIIGGTVCEILGAGGNTIAVLLDGVPTGLYTRITYGYTVNGEQKSEVVEGSPIATEGRLNVTLSASFNADGTLTVKATDENDMPARQYKVQLTLEGMPEQGTTNDKGEYTSTFRVSEGKDASFAGEETGYSTFPLIYEASEKQSITRPLAATTAVTTTTSSETTTTTSTEDTTTTVEETTTTTEQQVDATTVSTATTTATVKGDSTTALENGKVAANALTDTALLEAFGKSRQEFLSAARLLLSEEDYQALVGRTGNVPMLSVRTAQTEVTSSMIQAALTNVSEFSGYAEDQRQALTFDLSLVMLSRYGKDVPITALPEDILYTVQLPVPTPMKHCSAFAITVMDGNALMTPQVVEVKNGMFELTINSLEAYTLIGFGEENEENAGGFSWRLIVLLLAGILLIGGAATLLYFFVFRKPEEMMETEEESEPEVTPDSDTDIFSGRTDMENTWEPEDN